MAGFDIQAKVKSGLSKAIAKTGSASSELVYLIEMVGGTGTPSSPITPTENPVLLVDAIFKSITTNNMDDTLIESGARSLVCNGDVEIEQSAIIAVGANRYIVQAVDVKNPAGVPLAYIATVAPQ